MGNEATVTETQNDNGGAEVVAVDVEATTDAAVNKALSDVASMVENIAKAAGINLATPNPAPPAAEATPAAEDVDTEKATDKRRGMYKAQLAKAGISGDAMTKAMAEYDKAFPPFPPAQKTTKSAEPTPEQIQAAEEADAVKALTLLEQAVSKAKRFTPARVAELQKAVEALQKLLAVVDVPQGTSPKTSTPGNTMFGASGVQELTKSINALTETVTKSISGLTERVETIEKARTPATALESEETETTTEPVKKGFWEGVL